MRKRLKIPIRPEHWKPKLETRGKIKKIKMILKISQLKKLRHRRTLVVLLIFTTVIIYVLILVQEHLDDKNRPTLLKGKKIFIFIYKF